MMTPAQLRAARGFLDLSREQLAEASGVSAETIRNIEVGRFRPEAETANKLRLTFMREGVGFFDVLTHFPLWGVVFQKPHAVEQDNRPMTEGERATQEHLSLADRMAAAIAATIRRRGHCRPCDLEGQGFTTDEIASAWLMASPLAQVALDDERGE